MKNSGPVDCRTVVAREYDYFPTVRGSPLMGIVRLQEHISR